MADLLTNNPITVDGDYDVKVDGDTEYNVNIAGTFGNGTVVVKEKNEISGAYSPVSTLAPITSNFTDVLQARNGANIRFSLTGATAPSITVHIVGLRNG